MTRNLKQTLNHHPSLVYNKVLKEICKPLEKLGILYFSHVHIDETGKFSALGLEPEFVKIYFEKEYYRFDIHMAKSRLTEQYVLWDSIERIKESKELFDDFISFSLGHTFTIQQQNGKTKDYYHFAGKLNNNSINDNYLRNLDLLKRFILYYKEKLAAHKELRQGLEIKFEIPKDNSGYLIAHNSEESICDFNKETQLNRFYIQGEQYITHRELECLYWLSSGKTLDQIAVILGITLRTVKAHIKNIKEKFNCNNQFQLGTLYCQLTNVISHKLK